jgi:two-component system nitrate/nitrite response regulator NarL
MNGRVHGKWEPSLLGENGMIEVAKLVIVDSNRLFREGLGRLLEGNRLEVVKEAYSFVGALRFLQSGQTRLDIILGDPGTDLPRELEAVKVILSQFPEVKVVILTDRFAPQWPEEGLKSSVAGFLSKDISAEALMRSLDLVLMGERVIKSAARRAAAGTPAARWTAPDPAAELLAKLSGRENQILDCLAHGLPNKLIARELNMAEATVKVHLKALLRKLNAQNRTQAAIWAIKTGSTDSREMDPTNVSVTANALV